MLSVFLVVIAGLLVVGAGELVRSKCRQMLSTPPAAAPTSEDVAAPAPASV